MAGGDQCISEVAQKWSPGRIFLNAYGPTEAAITTTIFPLPADWNFNHSIPIGRPIANTQIYILDGNGRPVPRGLAGELYMAACRWPAVT